jgi:hypothetical protein
LIYGKKEVFELSVISFQVSASSYEFEVASSE